MLDNMNGENAWFIETHIVDVEKLEIIIKNSEKQTF